MSRKRKPRAYTADELEAEAKRWLKTMNHDEALTYSLSLSFFLTWLRKQEANNVK